MFLFSFLATIVITIAHISEKGKKKWHACSTTKCPFIYCPECWNDIDQKCLACDPGLAELSDVDSWSGEDHPGY